MNTIQFKNEINETFEQFFKVLKRNDLYNEVQTIRFELNEYFKEIIEDYESGLLVYKLDFIKYFKNKIIGFIFSDDAFISDLYIDNGFYKNINNIINQYLETTVETDKEEEKEKVEKLEERRKELLKQKGELEKNLDNINDKKEDLKNEIIEHLKNSGDYLENIDYIKLNETIKTIQDLKELGDYMSQKIKEIVDQLNLIGWGE